MCSCDYWPVELTWGFAPSCLPATAAAEICSRAQGVNLPSGDEVTTGGERAEQELIEFGELQRAAESRCLLQAGIVLDQPSMQMCPVIVI